METMQTVDTQELEAVEGGILPLIAGALLIMMVGTLAVETGYAVASLFPCE
jgi:lactobin A/cerein 7B family class IIb bacteriocin